MTRLNTPAVTDAWDDAYAYKAHCVRREAERGKPVPVLTMRVLLAWSAFWFTLTYLAGWMVS